MSRKMTLGDINTLAALILAVVGSAFALWRWMVGTLRAVEAENRAEISKMYTLVETRTSELHGRINVVKDRVASFELDVAKYYASDDRLQQMEAKFTLAIEKMINRFDAFATDFNKVVGRMERANQDAPRI
jgi:methyl-accepting chemotaxis protein